MWGQAVGKIVLGVMLGLMGLGIIGFLIVAAAVHSVASSGTSSLTPTPINDSHAIHVSAVKLWSDYHANEVAADNMYKGQPLIVTGMVKGINKDILDDAYLTLSTFNEFESVDAHLQSSELAKAARMSIYQPVTVACTGGGMVIGSPVLRDCIIQANQENPPAPAANTETNTQQLQPVSNQTDANNAGTVQPQQAPVCNETDSLPKMVSGPSPEFTAAASANHIQGTVVVGITVDESGSVKDARIIKSLGYGLDENALAAVQQYKFVPARQHCQPVSAAISVNVGFRSY